ncbi:MAG: hypothetical protein ACLTYW_11100 [Collinsella sp.]
MDKLAKPKNRALFLVSVAVTGRSRCRSLAVLFAMEHGIDYLWTEIPHMLGASPELASGPFGFCRIRFSSACWAACSSVCTKR